MKTLVWHWGRRGAGPIFAARLAEALNGVPGQSAALSLPSGAEILAGRDAPPCDWREPTYTSTLGFIAKRLASPLLRPRTLTHLRRLAPDIALCAMPALLDAHMVAALRQLSIPYAVIAHDASAHPGDGLNFLALNQARLLRGAKHLFCLSGHVETALRAQGFGTGEQTLTKLWHPPMDLTSAIPPLRPTSRPKLLYFGRLLPYKGLDLLADALDVLRENRNFDLRVCGDGPNSPTLDRLCAMAGVSVERRWFADNELPELLAWSDALVLPYREASQSGVAALALAAGRYLLATAVGGLPEQLAGEETALLCSPTAPEIAHGLLQLTQLLARPRPASDGGTPGWQSMAAAISEAFG
ncbi:MAG TPA: glycosyltransferase [Acidocella sp.]|jgi:glycosyltransferase involved in cell wall biosynthesis|nr:glycosyltransferase [Acidocella sp.]